MTQSKSLTSSSHKVLRSENKPNYFELLNNSRIFNEDCVRGMSRLPDNSFDIAILDPPYAASSSKSVQLDKEHNLPGMGGSWNITNQEWDQYGPLEYFNWATTWLKEVKRLVKPTGSIWIFGTYHNIGIINFILQLIDVEIINQVAWFKRNSFPNLRNTRLTASHEDIIWCHTGGRQRDYFFNADFAKHFSAKYDLIKKQGKQMRTVWDIPNNKAAVELQYGKHPTQKPMRVIERLLGLSAQPGGTCLIPFLGGGTEALAAIKHGLTFTAFERDTEKGYVDLAKKRLLAFVLSEQTVQKTTKTSTIVAGTEEASAARYTKEIIPSVIKWSGGKRALAHSIDQVVPVHNNYFEPFLGGGALLYCASKKSKHQFGGDVYRPLVEFWNELKENPKVLSEKYEQEWQVLQKGLQQSPRNAEHFYKIGTRFNKNPNPYDLLFLSRTCVNGVIRFNEKGHFNNSFHGSRDGMKPKTLHQNILKWTARLSSCQFIHADFQFLMSLAKSGDFVYLDPPYVHSKNRYIQNLNFEHLLDSLEELNRKGVRWALSFDGSRGKQNLEYDFPKELYVSKLSLQAGHSLIQNVLQQKKEMVTETLFTNYDTRSL